MKSNSEFKPGQEVLVKRLRKYGVVVEASIGGSILVQVGSLRMKLKPDQISAREEDAKLTAIRSSAQKGAALAKKSSLAARRSLNKRVSLAEIDLHGKSVAEGISALEQFINSSILAGYQRLLIIHGKGSGKLRDAVHKYLDNCDVISRYSYDPQQAGQTLVYL